METESRSELGLDLSAEMQQCLDDIAAAAGPNVDPDASFEEYMEALERASEAVANAAEQSDACRAAEAAQ